MTLAERCGADSPARRAAIEALMQRLHDAHIEQVRVAWADVHGSFRAKTLVGADTVAAALRDGVGMVGTLLLKDTSDRTAFKVFEPGAMATPGLERLAAAGNVLLLPDPASLQLLPWAPGTGWLRADALFDDGTPVAADPRGVLQRAVQALAAHEGRGLQLQVGLEVEFHVWRIAGGPTAAEHAAWPAEPPALQLVHPGHQLLGEAAADRAAEVLDSVRRTALALGLPLRSLEVEFGPSQFEAVFAPVGALQAADHMVLLRNHLRQALARCGYHASFVCKPPLPDAVASGWHLHQSLIDAGGGNAFAPRGAGGRGANPAQQAGGGNVMVPTAPAGANAVAPAGRPLSDIGLHWLAGLLAHARGMAALCASTPPAYARFAGSVMAPQAAVWGCDNRGALLRVLGHPDDGDGTAVRIENRLGEPMANPYLAIAAQIHAGLDGLQRRLDPGPPVTAAYAAGLPPLPSSLPEALDALAADAVLQRGLGPAMAAVYAAVKRQEVARHAEAEDPAAWERREYLGRF